MNRRIRAYASRASFVRCEVSLPAAAVEALVALKLSMKLLHVERELLPVFAAAPVPAIRPKKSLLSSLAAGPAVLLTPLRPPLPPNAGICILSRKSPPDRFS